MQSIDFRKCWKSLAILRITQAWYWYNLQFNALNQSVFGKSQGEETNLQMISSDLSHRLNQLRSFTYACGAYVCVFYAFFFRPSPSDRENEINCNIDLTRVKSVNVLLLLDSGATKRQRQKTAAGNDAVDSHSVTLRWNRAAQTTW